MCRFHLILKFNIKYSSINLSLFDYHSPVRKCLRVEKTRDGQDTAGQPDETDGDTSCALTHPRSQRINDGDITVGAIYKDIIYIPRTVALLVG